MNLRGVKSGCKVFGLKKGAAIKGETKVSWVLAALSLCEGQVEEGLARALEIFLGALLSYSDQNELCTPFEEDLVLRIQGLTCLHSL